MKRIVVLVLSLVFLMGCATAERGRSFDTSKSQQIEIGKTTEAEVIALLGAPIRTKIKENGDKAVLYAHAEAKAAPFSVKSNSQHVAILFDKNGIVKAIDRGSI